MLGLVACGTPETKPPISVFAAASLARPLATLADSFQHRTGIPLQSELGGSLEQSRKITDLGRVPDVLLLVDDAVIAALVPKHLDWYVRFGTNRIVLAYTAKSRGADSITSDNWHRIVSRPGVLLGRADPNIAPAGRHALTVIRRAAGYYKEPRLTDALMARSPETAVRPNASELAALLETAEVDYILDYESVARQYGFKFVSLPEDLAVAVLYGISVPRLAAHRENGESFVSYVLSEDGKRVLRDANITLLPVPVAVGTNVPSRIAELVRTLADRAPTR